MKNASLLLFLLSGSAYANGPIFQHQDSVIQQEFENVYKDQFRMPSVATFTYVNISQNLDVGNTKITRVSSGTVSSDAARYSQVRIIQTVHGSVEASSATTATSYVASNLSKSITINSGNRVRIFVTGHLRSSDMSRGAMATILRNGANIGPGNGFCFPVSAGAITDGLDLPCSMSITDDNPGGTTVTYSVGIKAGSAPATATWCNQGTHAEITLDEINGQ